MIPQDGPPRPSRDGSRPNNDIYAIPHRKKPPQFPKQKPCSEVNVPPPPPSKPLIQQNNIPKDLRGMIVLKPYIQSPPLACQPTVHFESKKEYVPPSDEDLKNYRSSRIFPMCYNLKCQVCNGKEYPPDKTDTAVLVL